MEQLLVKAMRTDVTGPISFAPRETAPSGDQCTSCTLSNSVFCQGTQLCHGTGPDLTDTWSTSHVRMSLTRALAHTLRRAQLDSTGRSAGRAKTGMFCNLFTETKTCRPVTTQSRSQRYPLELYCRRDRREQYESRLRAEATP